MPAAYSATVDYAFNGTDSLGRVGTGNDLAVTIAAVPETSTFGFLFAGGALLVAGRRHFRKH